MKAPDYRRIVETSTNAIFTVDSNGILTYMNPYGLQLFGYSEDHLIGRSVIGAVLTESPENSRINEDIMVHPERYEWTLPDNMDSEGEPVWLLWSNFPIRDSEGKLVGITAIGRDITEIVTRLGDGDPEKGFQSLKAKVGVSV